MPLFGNLVRHEVVESVIAAFKRLLVGESRLLKEVHHHVSPGKFSRLSDKNSAPK